MMSKQVLRASSLVLIMVIASLSPLLNHESESTLKDEPISMLSNPALDVDFNWWEVDHPANNVGLFTATAVDSNDELHIAYYDATSGVLKYATYDGSSWTTTTVDSAGNVGQHTSIAIDSNDNLHISYLDYTNTNFKYATYDGSSWTVSIIDIIANVGYDSSIAVDSNDNLHISYYDNYNGDLKYATYDGSSWTVSTISSTDNVGWYSSIAVDSNDNLHISHHSDTNGDLMYTTYDGSSWTTSTLDSTDLVGRFSSIAIDSNDNLHISYFDETNWDLKYAHHDGSSWTLSTVDSTGNVASEPTSIEIDSNDDVSILYQANDELNIVMQTDGSWSSPQSIDVPTGGDVGIEISSDLDSNDQLRISYRGDSASKSGYGLYHIQMLSDLRIDSLSPNSAEVGNATNVTITGAGFDQLPQYQRDIDISNDFDYGVENYSIIIENPTLDETDLIASYHMDDDEVDLTDSSGYYNDGDIHGATYVDTDHGQGLDFDGVDDYVYFPTINMANSSSDDFTFCGWWEWGSYPGQGGTLLFSNRQHNNPYSTGIDVSIKQGLGGIELRTTSDSDVQSSATFGAGMGINTWYHICVISDSTDYMVAFDGTIDPSDVISKSGLQSWTQSGGYLEVGGYGSFMDTGYTDGNVDEIKIYDRALSDIEIAELYNSSMRADYGDVRFWDDDGSSLEYEMSYDGYFMVNIPSMYAFENRTISMTYGAKGLESESQDLDDWFDDSNSGIGEETGGFEGYDSGFTFEENTIAYWTLDDEAEGAWDTSIVDSTGNVGPYSSMVLDSNENLHISYQDVTNQALKHSTFDGSSWTTSTVDNSGGGPGDVGKYSSIAVDSSDNLHISYYDDGNGDLKYATFDGSSWTDETVESTGDVGGYTSIVVDSNDDIHVSYYDHTNNNLKYATYDGSSWTISIIDNTGYVGWFSSIAIDSNDNLHVSYLDVQNVDLKYATYDGSSWTTSTVDSTNDVGHYTSIAVDSSDDIHISYRDATAQSLKYTTYDGSSWTTATIDSTGNVGMYTSIAIDSDDIPHISYYNQTHGNLNYVTFDDGSLIKTTIDDVQGSNTVGVYGSSIVLDSNDNVHISYLDYTNYNLKYAIFDTSVHTGDLLDSSNDYPASSNGEPVITNGVGMSSPAVNFDGTDDYLVAYPPTSTDFNIGTGDFTVSAWVKPESISGYDMVFHNGDFEIKYSSSTWGANFGGTNGPVYMTSDGPELDEWVLATLVRDSSDVTPMIYFYLDGVEIHSEVSNSANLSTYQPLYIGAADTGGAMGDFLAGTIDEVFVLDVALTESEILKYYRDTSGPRMFYDMNEDSGDLGDQSGNDIEAIAVGSPSYEEDGKIETSIGFDGSSSSSFSIASGDDSDFSKDGNSFTVNAWVKLDSDTGDDQWIISQQNSAGLSNEAFQMKWTRTSQDVGYWECNVNVGSGVDFLSAQSSVIDLPTEWTMVTCMFESGGYGVDLLVDGEFITYDTSYTTPMENADASISIGEDSAGNHDVEGRIDDIQFFDHIMELDAIMMMYLESNRPVIHLPMNAPAVASWATSAVDSTVNVGDFSSIAIDSNDNLHISYYDLTNADLKYATYDGSSWTSTTIDSAGEVGQHSSIAIDSNDNLHISYYDITNYDLKYATYDGSSWTTSTVDSTGDVGRYTSIAVDSNDDLHISYYDATNGDLKYATYDGSSWSTSTIDSTNNVGYYSSIAIDSNDDLHISHYSDTNGDLKYTTYDGSSWTTSTVDSTGVVGSHASIAVDSNDDLHISYHDDTNMNLKYATYDGSSWTISTVDSTNNVGWFSSIAIDSNDNSHISYLDYTNYNLKYATYDGSSWTVSTVDSTGSMGMYGSLAVDSNDDLHISYHDQTNQNLKYATIATTGPCVSTTLIDRSGNGNTGTLVGNPNCGEEGYYGDAIGFDGVDDYVSIAAGDWQDSPTASVGYHVHLDSLPASGEIFGFKAQTPPAAWPTPTGIGLGITSTGNVVCAVDDGSSATTAPTLLTTNLSIEVGTWYHLLCSWDGEELNLYVNGSHSHTFTPSSSFTMDWDSRSVYLGKFHYGSNYHYTEGVYDNFDYWNFALPENIVGMLFQMEDEWIDNSNTVDNTGVIGSEQMTPYEIHLDGFVPALEATNVVFVDATTITCTFPASAIAGMTDVDLIDSNGGVVAYLSNAFEYITPPIVDSDGDGWADADDAFPYDWTQWLDTDGDGYGDNISGNNSDAFPYEATQWSDTDGDGFGDNPLGNNSDTFPTEPTQWNDTDGDGYGDNPLGNNSDAFPNEATQWLDGDGDGYGDNPLGNNSDAFPSEPTQWNDTDGDGYGDNPLGNNSDAFPNDPTQWADSDGDGFGDNLSGNNPDVFPSEPTQWNDTDSDGYGDNTSGYEGDDCPAIWGNSTNGRYGCIDSDGDGLADVDDAFPNDPLRGGDSDGDGYDDALDDDCALIWGNSTQDRVGCIDYDGDGYSDADLNWTVFDGADAFMSEPSQWNDTDNDGYGDNATGFEADDCPTTPGYSTILSFGCPDADSDGLSDSDDACPNSNSSIGNDTDGDGCFDGEDAFPDDASEHADSDNDGLGDNSDPEPQIPMDTDGDGYPDRVGYNDTDDCPEIYGNSTIDRLGCLDSDGDGLSDVEDAFPYDLNRTKDDDNDGFDDIIEDDCPEETGNSTIDRSGCLDTDGDGHSDLNDLFPFDNNDWFDDDGDGVGNNSDAFPNDANETKDSDLDGVGDNSDVFPADKNETADTDGDGIGDNGDLWPYLNNSADSDGDGTSDIDDPFPYDSSQWQDYDGDGYGDSVDGNDSDAFINNATQWADGDGDGYGDNWGDSEWNGTRLLLWPGVFVADAFEADHCPSEWGNSTTDGYYGCPDLDGDGIADQYDDLVDVPDPETGGEDGVSVGINETDTDDDGVVDLYDVCPETNPGATVDSDGCKIDEDKDGVEDLYDNCPKTPRGSTVNVEGCVIVIEEAGVIDQLLAGEQQAIIKTVGWSTLIIAILGFMQTNMVAALLPDAFKWLQFAKRRSNLSKEEEQELTHLQSIVQAYHSDDELLVEELQNLKSDITARYTNSEIKKETREKINTLIEDLIGMDPQELMRIADDERYFGLVGTMGTDERSDLLSQDMAMRDYDRSERKHKASGESDESEFKSKNTPPKEKEGEINEEDGHEYLEWPDSSGRWFIRNKRTKLWDEWKD